MEGRFEVKKFTNERSFYARVCLEVEEIWPYEVQIDIGEFKEWDKAIGFAAHYFFDHYRPSGKKRGLEIKIIELHSMDVDSNNMVIFYAIVQALHNAFNKECHIIIDDSGNFVVPK
jgi:hypothetical protein